MRAGDVVRWERFSLHRLPGEDKRRWIICLGDTGAYASPREYFLITTTTSLNDFKQGGKRYGRKVVTFTPAVYTCFSEECLVDVEYDKFDFPAAYIVSSQDDTEVAGKISQTDMVKIWSIIAKSTRYSPRVKKEIKRCLEESGYTLR